MTSLKTIFDTNQPTTVDYGYFGYASGFHATGFYLYLKAVSTFTGTWTITVKVNSASAISGYSTGPTAPVCSTPVGTVVKC